MLLSWVVCQHAFTLRSCYEGIMGVDTNGAGVTIRFLSLLAVLAETAQWTRFEMATTRIRVVVVVIYNGNDSY